MALWKLHYVEIFSSYHIPAKSLQWIWKWHYYDIWIPGNVLSSINLNVSGTHPADALITTIIIYNDYTKQSKTHDFRYIKFIYLHCGEEMKLRDPRT